MVRTCIALILIMLTATAGLAQRSWRAELAYIEKRKIVEPPVSDSIKTADSAPLRSWPLTFHNLVSDPAKYDTVITPSRELLSVPAKKTLGDVEVGGHDHPFEPAKD